jgi:uncharacterized FAD-dependent dehydrogenase
LIRLIRVSNIKVDVDHRQQVLPPLLRKLGISREQISDYRIYRESIDARRAGMIHFVYTVDVTLADESALLPQLKGDRDISVTPDLKYDYPPVGQSSLSVRPVIVGTGPAGLFAGLLLAEMGYRPLLLERGGAVDERVAAVERFWRSGQLDQACNVQFGEGGAGTFSDGKLTTLIKDKRGRKVLQELVAAGAPEEVIYSQKPHVGTDRLRSVVRNLRERIVTLGGEVQWRSQVTEVVIRQQQVRGVVINGDRQLPAELVVLAIGHSARDTFAMLHAQGVGMQPKPFSIGVRIEHPQRLIDQAQYKRFAGHKNLGAADYKLAYHSPSGRSAYTFCMCPGGEVVAAASEPGYLCTNGMSEYARGAENANSALLVGVGPEDFGSQHPLAGVEFQRRWERQAFQLGGGNYTAPAQLVGDFLTGSTSKGLGRVTPSYRLGVRLTDLSRCLPPYVVRTLQEAIPEFGRKLQGFDSDDAVLTGVETRSSSPVRILRGEDYQSNVGGLYPCGEGAGYAGGIISAAVDGLRVAEAIIRRFRPFV